MSGGSYDYAYSKINELSSWVRTLELMAQACRTWSEGEPNSREGAFSLEERSSLVVRALLLENGAKRLRNAIEYIYGLEKIMHDVEWTASGDYSVESLLEQPLQFEG
jgi:hypothetical protein